MTRLFSRTAVVIGLALFVAVAASADGKLKLSLPGQSRLAVRAADGSAKSLTSADGVFSLPAGNYSITGYSSAAKTKTGESWSVFATAVKPVSVTVKDGKTTPVKLAEPFVASVKVSSQDASNISMNFKTFGASGESVSIYGPKPPGFLATAKTGGSWSGSFKYG